MGIHNLLHEWVNADWEVEDPGDAGAIPSNKTGIVNIVTAGAETRTLADPVNDGTLLVLNFLTDGGDCVITVASAYDQHSSTTITLATAGDMVALESIKFGSGFRWRVLSRQLAADPSPAELDTLDGLTATVAELNKLDDSLTASVLMSAGAGVSAAEGYGGGVFRNGGLIVTRIFVDLAGLVGSATDLDIIGNTGGAASANFGQITAAKNGTIVGGKVTCLEVPAGGADDIDFYSASVGTGAQDVIITDASLGTEVALITSGAAWTLALTKAMALFPAADDFLYIVNGEAVGGTFTAGKFLIELYGVP